MKKIGIVTYYRNYNYGSILQAYALSKVIDNLGYFSEIVDYLDYKKNFNRYMKKRTYRNKLVTMATNPQTIISTIRRKSKSLETISSRSPEAVKKFDEFTDNYIRLSKGNYLDNLYDAVVCGSDQVWRVDTPGLDELFFLRPFDSNKRIAYAPSIGVENVPTYNMNRFKKYINDIRFISVREESAATAIKKITGFDIPVVVDPVILAGREFWDNITNDRVISEPYVLCYFLDKSESSINAIKKMRLRTDARMIWVDSGVVCNDLDYNTCIPDPLEFVNLIRHANFVYTDSFHATAFAIMLHTKFMVFDRNYGSQSNQNTRIDNILRLTNHTNTKYNGDLYSIQYDFITSDERLSNLRNRSYNYLKVALAESTRSEK